MVALGIFCLLFQNFIVGRPPGWPQANPILGFVGGPVLIIAAVGVMLKKVETFAALTIALLILLFVRIQTFSSVHSRLGECLKSACINGWSIDPGLLIHPE
jgi:hypothetical protein